MGLRDVSGQNIDREELPESSPEDSGNAKRKSPGLAAVLTMFFFPFGLGYIYLKKWKRVAVSVIILWILFALMPPEVESAESDDVNLWSVIMIPFWFIVIYDSYAQAVKHNKKHGLEKEKLDKKESGEYHELREVKETRCICNQCSKVWHYLKKDEDGVRGAKSHNLTKNLVQATACCGSPVGCFAAAIPEKKVKDLDQCPNCKSRDIKRETITYKR